MNAIDPTLLQLFREEATDTLSRCDELLPAAGRGETAAAALQELFRLMHNLKGSARLAGMSAIHATAHTTEDLLSKWRDAGVAMEETAIASLRESLAEMLALLAD